MTLGRSLWGEPGSSLQTPSPATSRPARFLPAEVRVALAAVTSASWHVPQTCWSPCGTRGLPCLVALGSGARARQGQLPETEAILATFHQKRARRRKRGVRRAPGGVGGHRQAVVPRPRDRGCFSASWCRRLEPRRRAGRWHCQEPRPRPRAGGARSPPPATSRGLITAPPGTRVRESLRDACSPRAQDALAMTRAPGARADRRPRRRDPEVTDGSETRKVSCSCDHLIFV